MKAGVRREAEMEEEEEGGSVAMAARRGGRETGRGAPRGGEDGSGVAVLRSWISACAPPRIGLLMGLFGWNVKVKPICIREKYTEGP